MAFAIVQNRNFLEIVPENWLLQNEANTIVFWPPTNWTILQRDASTAPSFASDLLWKAGSEYVKRRGIRSYAEAEAICQKMKTVISESEASDNSLDQHQYFTRQSLVTPSSTQSQKVPTFNVPQNVLGIVPASAVSSKAARKLIYQENVPHLSIDDNNEPSETAIQTTVNNQDTGLDSPSRFLASSTQTAGQMQSESNNNAVLNADGNDNIVVWINEKGVSF